jgi:Zn-dependent protease/predicted transcriptional regulator
MGKLLGIPIQMHFTLLIGFLLVAVTLTIGFMPNEYPGLPLTLYLAMGIFGAILLFLSVLIHELAHSHIALRNKLKVNRIVLFIFGGVSEIMDEPKDSSVEFRLALAGPFMSFTLAGLLGGLWFVIEMAGYNVLATALRYGSLINLLLGGFNLVPAFPMDGGRVLRAGLWKMTHDRYRATVIASRVGIAFAYVFMGLSLIMSFVGYVLNGIWFIFIGWFLKSGAESGLNQNIISEALSTMKVTDIMSPTVHTVDPNSTLKDVVDNNFLVYKHGGFPVVEDGDSLGIIALSDIKKIPKEKWSQKQCREVMTPFDRLVFIKPEDPATEALLKMSKYGIGRLIVLRNGSLAGIISRSDLTKTIRTRMQISQK